MNPIGDAKPFRIRLLYLTGLNSSIAIVVALMLWLSPNRDNQHSLSVYIIESLIHSTIYGLMFGLIMPYLGERLSAIRPPWSSVAIVASLMLIALVSSMVVELSLLGFGFLRVNNFWPEFFYKSLGVFIIALTIGLGVYTYEKFRDQMRATNLQLRTREMEKERALKLVTEARLASLESRLHPHFLFNTLNSISALILEDPLLADDMVQRLASLLRRSLDACEQSQVMFSEEIKLVTDYLEIEKARFGERMLYSIDLKPGVEALAVPPLTLQPVVENSIKFAVSPSPAGGEIKISALLQTGRLIIEVWDNGPGFTAEMIPRGHGLDNLQARLAAMFGDEAELCVNSQNRGTTVTVCLPLKGCQSTK
jgi:two-component system, LytTR family, sensor histidine kinase AlgZ